MAESSTPSASIRRSALPWPIRLLRLPFDLLFLTWDFLRLKLWVVRNLPALLFGGRPAPFGPLFASGVIETTADGTLWHCSLAAKYGTKSLLRLLFRGLRWHQTADGRRYLCWQGSRSQSPTTLWRFVLTGVFLACLWLIPVGCLLWHYRHLLPLPRGLTHAGTAVPGADGSALLRRDPDQAAQLVAQATEAESDGRTAAARAVFRSAAARDPNLLDAHLGVGRTSQALGFADAARQAFARALELAPAEPAAVLGLARALHSQGAERKAIELLHRLAHLTPESAEAHVLLSSCHLALGELDQAAAAMEQALALAPEDQATLAAAAETALRRGQIAEAERHYRALVDRDAKDMRARVGLARIARFKGDLREAEALLTALLVEAPSEVQAIEELIDVQGAAGQPAKALETCRDSMAKYPDQVRLREKHLALLSALGRDNDLYVAGTRLLADNAGNLAAHLHLAAMFLRRGLPALAIDHCTKALAQQPGSEHAYRLLISAQLLAGDLESARERLERLLARLPEDLDAIIKLADYHRRKNDAASAVALLRKGVEYHPGSPIARSQLAQMLFLSGDTAGALIEFREVQRQAPDDPKALNNAAAAIVHAKGDLDEALAYAEKARALEPANAQVLDTLAWVHARRGNPEQALPLCELAVALQPDSPILRYHHGSILAALGRKDEAKKALRAALIPGVDFHGSTEARELLGKLSGEAAAQAEPASTPTP
jgi:tetratricopeptide (TPR) repeat protein